MKDGDITAWVKDGTVAFKLTDEALSIVTDPYSIRSEQRRVLEEQRKQQPFGGRPQMTNAIDMPYPARRRRR